MYSTVCDAQKTCYASRLSTQAWARHTACCPQLVRCKPKRSCCTSVATRIASNTAASTPVTLQEFDDFELLWLEYRHGLSISKEVALWALEDVQLGLLPCDAELLRDRAQQLTGLPQTIPKLDSRRLLNTSRSLLKYGSGHLEETIKKLLQLLPRASSSNPTQLVQDTAADLDLPPEVLALQYQELGTLFQASLGAWITEKPLHHLLHRLRDSQQQHQPEAPAGGQPVKQQRSTGSAFAQVLQTSAGITEQLEVLKQLMGAELAHAAVSNTPQLLDAPAAHVHASLQWLQHQLRLSPVAALLLAEQQGQVLLYPVARLEQNYSNICYLLQQLVGWRLQQVHSLLCNAPELLIRNSQQLATNWQQVQQLSRKRLSWMKELAAAEGPLLTVVLSCNRRQLLMLQYTADSGELKGRGLLQILRMEYADFVKLCPGFRTWRSLAPGRWRIVEVWGGATSSRDDVNNAVKLSASRGSLLGPMNAVAAANGATDKEPIAERVTAGSSNSSKGGSSSSSSRIASSLEMKPVRKVLAVDKFNRPVLMQVGELGPYDRLA